MAPPQHHFFRALLRAWHGSPGPGAAPRHLPLSKPSALHSTRPALPLPPAGVRLAHTSTSPRLKSPFLSLLRSFVDPAIRGALQVLRNTKPTPANALTPQFRDACLRAQPIFARTAKRPSINAAQMVRAQRAASQGSRNFTQSTAQHAHQVVLGLRLAGDDARDKLLYGKIDKAIQKNRRKQARALTESQKSANGRTTSNQRVRADIKKLVATKPAAPDHIELAELNLYFPEPPKAPAPRPDVAAELIVPLDPDLSNIWDLTSQAASHHQLPVYNGNLGSAARQTSTAYDIHLQKTRELHAVLQDLCACVLPSHQELSNAPHAAHGIGYKIIVPNVTAQQVREVLIDRLGVQQGLWFGKLLRDVNPARIEEKSMPVRHFEGAPQPPSPHSSPSLMSPPQADWDTLSLDSSWDGMLHEPPSSSSEGSPALEFSSTFMEAVDENHYPSYSKVSQFGLYEAEAQGEDGSDDSAFLQDSRY